LIIRWKNTQLLTTSNGVTLYDYKMDNEMKKQIILIMVTVFITILSACGGQTAQTPLEPASPTETVLQPTKVPAQPETIAPASTDTVPATTDSKTNVSFINDVMPIFERRCVKCHGGQQTKEGFDLKTYEGLMSGSFNGPVLEPGNANGSYLVEQIINGEMPKRGPKLTPNETQIITDWINSGAINN
jgi:hypothetical protein